MSLGITANKERNGALLAYIAGNIQGIHLRKLLKIVYLIDEHFTLRRCFPLTWFNYQAWEKGPVAPEVYEVKNGAFGEYVSCRREEEGGSNIVRPVVSSPYELRKRMEDFSAYELQVIDSVLAEYGECTPEELTELTHREGSLWSQVKEENALRFENGRSEVELPLTRLLGNDEEAEDRYAEALGNMEFQAALNKHREENVQTA